MVKWGRGGGGRGYEQYNPGNKHVVLTILSSKSYSYCKV